jgi:hypothetical protein
MSEKYFAPSCYMLLFYYYLFSANEIFTIFHFLVAHISFDIRDGEYKFSWMKNCMHTDVKNFQHINIYIYKKTKYSLSYYEKYNKFRMIYILCWYSEQILCIIYIYVCIYIYIYSFVHNREEFWSLLIFIERTVRIFEITRYKFFCYG